MPVIDQKPIIKDCDDDHHKKLIERQQKDTNDAMYSHRVGGTYIYIYTHTLLVNASLLALSINIC